MRTLAVLLALAGAARADGFADDLHYHGRPLTHWLLALRGTDRPPRLAASRVLNRVGPEALEAAPALLMGLKTDDDTVRDRVAAALARIGPGAVPLLTAALTFDDDRIREGAARALRRLGPDARPARRTLEYAFPRATTLSLRADLLEALWAVSGEPRHLEDAAVLIRKGAILRHSASFLHRYGRDAGPMLEAFVEQLDARGPQRREAAREGLLAIGHESLPAIVQALKSGTPTARLEAADLLGRFHPPADYAVPALRTAFTTGSPGLRAATARSLGRIGVASEETGEVLRRGLSDPSADVRAECATALGALRAEAADLAKLLADDDPGVMNAARAALVRLGKAAVPALIDAARGTDELARRQALRALMEIGPDAREAVTTLTALAGDRRSVAAADAVVALERLGAVEPLTKLAWDGTAADMAAVAALGRMKAVSARATLLAALADRSVERRRAVIDALGRLGPPAALLEQGMNPALRPAVLAALARLDVPTRDALPLLLRALRDPDQQDAAVAFIERQGLDGVPTSECWPLVDGEDRALARRVTTLLIEAGRTTARNLNGEESVPLEVLVTRLGADNPLDWRLGAARRLAAHAVAAKAAIPALLQLQRDIDAERREAEQAFGDLLALEREGDLMAPDAGDLIDAESQRLLADAIAAGRNRAPGASAMARAALRSVQEDHNQQVGAALRALGADEPTPAQADLLRLIHHDPEPALIGLARLGKRAAGVKPLLATMLSHPTPAVRRAANAALAALEGKAWAEPPTGYAARIEAADADGLAALLTERLRPSLRARALTRLADMGQAARPARPVVRQILREPFVEREVREAAGRALKAGGG